MKILSIKKPQEFKKVKDYGRSFASKSLIIGTFSNNVYSNTDNNDQNNKKIINNIKNCPQPHCRFGIIATKSIGKANKRNFAKRRIRAIINKIKIESDNLKLLDQNNDYVIIARKNLIELDFQTIYNDFKYCLKGLKKSKLQNKIKY